RLRAPSGGAKAFGWKPAPPVFNIAGTVSTTGTNVTKRSIRNPSRLRSVTAIATATAAATEAANISGLPPGNLCCRTRDWISNAGTSGETAATEWRTGMRNGGGISSVTCLRTYSANRIVPAGRAGRMYPGNLDCENEKKMTGTNSHVIKNESRNLSE